MQPLAPLAYMMRVVLIQCSSTPTGCNPSGCSASRERKLAVLEVCKKYDILIFEGESRARCCSAHFADTCR
jgi:tryptophan aminotransferase